MAIPPGLNISKDLASSYLNHEKANTAPPRSPQRFGATISTWLGVTGATTGFLGMPQVAGVFPVSPTALKGVADLKNSVGIFPAMITTFSGYKAGDKTATTLGAMNLLCATGFFRVAENLAKERAANITNPVYSQAVEHLPARIKFGIGLATIAYSAHSQMNQARKMD